MNLNWDKAENPASNMILLGQIRDTKAELAQFKFVLFVTSHRKLTCARAQSGDLTALS